MSAPTAEDLTVTGTRAGGRWARRSAAAAVTLVMAASPFLLTDPRSPWANANDPAVIALYSDGLAAGAPGTAPTLVAAGAPAVYLPGTRVLDPGPAARPGDTARAHALADEARAWLSAGTVPGTGGPYEDLARDALLDVRALLLDDGAAVAGWSARWRYVWPRDASFVAVALARTGHVDDAVQVLGFLQDVQHRDGSFEARYLPDGSGPPDDRGIQTDGTGWSLWATGQVLAEVPDLARRRATAATLRPLLDRSTAHALDLTDGPGTLPPPSSDYWEVGESRLTLGTVAPLLAGLHAAAGVYADLGRTAEARAAADRADRLGAAVTREFGPRFARYSDGHDADAASAFLLPPFQPVALPGAAVAWRASADDMGRPAGGLAPGEAWRDDGISWTPQTSLYAWVAAVDGDRSRAQGWLTWIDEHRTASGAIPEKVLADGSPAAVAPLAWSAACVLLTLDALDDRTGGTVATVAG
ncbi:glycoside hydrolase family 15 [uncultured Cellulomonas sp.]|uniref:glycoside hydrolase family 15 n=1 Tax=uncultured Cellulomonas sp. TaxID=189682 RepID=UPI0026068CAB|nr:glycoside hydrolase family 15 [uncultured Cellulomonas sp.]